MWMEVVGVDWGTAWQPYPNGRVVFTDTLP
jgi:hypothetical protein